MRLKSESRKDSLVMLFALQGILIQYVIQLNNYSNNLFATNLGATDAQIGLVPLAPNLAACILLLPLGLLAGRMRRSRTMLVIMSALACAGYLLYNAIPGLGPIRVDTFLVVLTFTCGSIAIYNAQWQGFFGDAAPPEARNTVFTYRNSVMFVVAIATPLLCGVLLSAEPDPQKKLGILMIFFIIAAAAMACLTLLLRRIPCREQVKAERKPIRLKEAFTNKRFMLFLVPFVIFYALWQIDWSMWYIGQVNYLGMNETELALYNAVFNVGQLLAMGWFSKKVKQWGPDKVVILTGIGLLLCPVSMRLSLLIQDHAISIPFFIGLVSLINMPQCAFTLCISHILLDTAPEDNKIFYISIYTMLTTLTNSFVPYLGVLLYQYFGSTRFAFECFLYCAIAMRLVGVGLFTVRYFYLKKHDMLTKVA